MKSLLACRALGFALALCVAALDAGCSRTEPHALPVDAATPRRLASWRENVFERFKPADWREFEAALQEIRLRVMAERQATGSAAVEEAMCTRINGHTFRGVLVMGYQARLARLDPVRAELKTSLDGNALLVSKPGDSRSAKYLESLRERQEERIRKTDAEIEQAEQRLVELAPSTWTENVAERKKKRAGPISPAALGRDEARNEITNFIRSQREAALLKYGAWPVKIATEPDGLPESERAEFLARRAAAATSGDAVIAVHVRDRWWIYDDKPELPTFSRSVLANLSELDRVNIESMWANWQAELWARKMAFEDKK